MKNNFTVLPLWIQLMDERKLLEDINKAG